MQRDPGALLAYRPRACIPIAEYFAETEKGWKNVPDNTCDRGWFLNVLSEFKPRNVVSAAVSADGIYTARVRLSSATLITKTRNHVASAAGTLTNATTIEARNTIGELKDLHVLARMNWVGTVFGRRR